MWSGIQKEKEKWLCMSSAHFLIRVGFLVFLLLSDMNFPKQTHRRRDKGMVAVGEEFGVG